MIKHQEPPIKLTLHVHGEKYQAILPWDEDLETIFHAFIGLLKDAGCENKEINEQINLLKNRI